MAPHFSSNISFWNSRGQGNKKLQLEEFLHSENIDIMAISETKFNLTTNQVYEVYKNYNLLHNSHLGGAEGIAILSKRNLPYSEIKFNLNSSTPKIMVCSYRINNKKIVVILI
jgi:exonuclease III